MIRPTPEHTEIPYAEWDEEDRRFYLKLKKVPPEGKCAALRCRHDSAKLICAKCRKRISRLNNPIAARVQFMKLRAIRRDQEFTIDAAYLERHMKAAGTWEAFMKDPSAFHIDRKNPLKGYVPGNVRVTTEFENLQKATADKKAHKNARMDAQNRRLFDFGPLPDDDSDPF